MNIKIKKWGTKILFGIAKEVDVNLRYPEMVVEQNKLENPITYCIDTLIKVVLRERNALGLCAPQIGINKRIIVTNVDGKIIVMINPKILSKSGGTSHGEEGCLSLPKVSVNVPRARNIKVIYYNENFEKCGIDATGLESVVIQHEIDHLDGKTIIDYLDPINKSKAINCMKKKKQYISRGI